MQKILPTSSHSPFAMKLEVSPVSACNCRFIAPPSYVQEPNFMAHSWSSKGNHAMFILHVLRKSPGGTQRQSPLDDTTTLVGYVLSISSSALQNNVKVIDLEWNKF